VEIVTGKEYILSLKEGDILAIRHRGPEFPAQLDIRYPAQGDPDVLMEKVSVPYHLSQVGKHY
jgi:hypothetical protein